MRRQKIYYSHQPVVALSLAALALYIPANLYPIMTMQYMGLYKETTIYQSIQTLFDDGMWFTGTVVFLASIAIPLLKIIGLLSLTLLASFPKYHALAHRLHALIDHIGRWSMLDVFLIAIMIALVKFGSFATVTADTGTICFTLVVLLTIAASLLFDVEILREEEANA